VEVSRGGHVVAHVGRGDGVGEMALLRAIPRTATVTAVDDVLAYALDREAFLVAVTGHARTTTAADSVVTSRFEELRELGLVANED
jgi:CRP-like cAMP-binding protein